MEGKRGEIIVLKPKDVDQIMARLSSIYEEGEMEEIIVFVKGPAASFYADWSGSDSYFRTLGHMTDLMLALRAQAEAEYGEPT